MNKLLGVFAVNFSNCRHMALFHVLGNDAGNLSLMLSPDGGSAMENSLLSERIRRRREPRCHWSNEATALLKVMFKNFIDVGLSAPSCIAKELERQSSQANILMTMLKCPPDRLAKVVREKVKKLGKQFDDV
jgi:hypothetical protein